MSLFIIHANLCTNNLYPVNKAQSSVLHNNTLILGRSYWLHGLMLSYINHIISDVIELGICFGPYLGVYQLFVYLDFKGTLRSF